MSASEGLSAVVAGGDLRASLVALRDFLAVQLECVESPRDAAPLAARLADVLDKIAGLPAPVEGTTLDELAQRRTDDGRVTARPARARRG